MDAFWVERKAFQGVVGLVLIRRRESQCLVTCLFCPGLHGQCMVAVYCHGCGLCGSKWYIRGDRECGGSRCAIEGAM